MYTYNIYIYICGRARCVGPKPPTWLGDTSGSPLSPSLSLSIYIYIYMYVCVYIYIYVRTHIYIYIYIYIRYTRLCLTV